MGAKVSQPAPLPEPSSELTVLQVSKYAAFGVIGCYIIKQLLGKASIETDRAYGASAPRDIYHFPNSGNYGTRGWDQVPNAGIREWDQVSNTGTRGRYHVSNADSRGWDQVSNTGTSGRDQVPNAGTRGRDQVPNAGIRRWDQASNTGTSGRDQVPNAGTRGRDQVPNAGIRRWDQASNTGTRGMDPAPNGNTRGSGRGFIYHDLETNRIDLARKLKACEDQINRLENVISCFQGNSPEAHEIAGELTKWIDYGEVIEENINVTYEDFDSNGSRIHYTPPLRISAPSDETMNTFMQHQMAANSLDKIFWDITTAKQKFVLGVIISELKANYPHEPECELQKGIVLAYNKHKWNIIPNEIRRYKKNSEKLFLQEKQNVQLLCKALNITMNTTNPLDKFVLWQTFQHEIGEIFWEDTTPEKEQLLVQLMGKLKRVHPTVPEQTLRRAVIQAFNEHKRGVRPRELNSTVKLVGKLLSGARKNKQHNDKDSEDVCSICLCEFDKRRVFLSCTHSFHYECICTWLEEEQSCPICRRDVHELPRIPPTPGPSVAYTGQSTHLSPGASRVQSIHVPPGTPRVQTTYMPTGTPRVQTARAPNSSTYRNQTTSDFTRASGVQSTHVVFREGQETIRLHQPMQWQ